MSGAAIPMQEVADLLRQALHGEVSLKLASGCPPWNTVYCGDVAFEVGGWSVNFYNDCDELDYVDSAQAPDGRHVDFDDWPTPGDGSPWCPLDLLTADERAALEDMLGAAR